VLGVERGRALVVGDGERDVVEHHGYATAMAPSTATALSATQPASERASER
jgi:hypothetical protein